MDKIDIIGRGNVASHLAEALKDKVDVRCVNPHTLAELRPDADMTLISVKDDVIKDIAAKLTNNKGIIAHTSGSVPLDTLAGALPGHPVGVFYPLQTFTKGVELDYSNIPFLIEGTASDTTETLKTLASQISNTVREADSTMRRKLHVASVLVCNFANHLWALAADYMESENIDFSLLIPLIDETAAKLHRGDPREVRTGPAVRKDFTTISAHLEQLKGYPEIAEVYRLLTDSIINQLK